MKRRKQYQGQIIRTLIGLIMFFAIYLCLTSYFCIVSYRFLSTLWIRDEVGWAGVFASLPSMLFALFFLRGLWPFGNRVDPEGIEVTPNNQPRLFEYLNLMADRTGASRPHRVFLTPGVNASVHHEVSIFNLLWPTRKNLSIGLSVVDSLNRSEFDAVVAHEFGHFGQSSTAVGRWVAMGARIAEQTVQQRRFVDSIADFLSNFDLRVAWIGWLLKSVLWSLRWVLWAFFYRLMSSHNAMLREMEFAADDTAADVAGGQALIHALYRLGVADENWEHTKEFVNEMAGREMLVENLFPLQRTIHETLRQTTGNGRRDPEIPMTKDANGDVRVFDESIATPPAMYATHPSNSQREQNLMETPGSTAIDTRSAWMLLDNADEVQRRVTEDMLEMDTVNRLRSEGKLRIVDDSEARIEYLKRHQTIRHDPAFRGLYLDHMATNGIDSIDDVDGTHEDLPNVDVQLSNLYPVWITEKRLLHCQNLNEILQLAAIQMGLTDRTQKEVPYKGQRLKHDQIATQLEQLIDENHQCDIAFSDHNLRLRRQFAAMAQQVDQRATSQTKEHGSDQKGWEDSYLALLRLTHYFENLTERLERAYLDMNHVLGFEMESSGGAIPQKRVPHVVKSARSVFLILEKMQQDAYEISLP
ncbi:MAG: M48 family metallopeptidase, partial [Planctomycetota bacterium]